MWGYEDISILWVFDLQFNYQFNSRSNTQNMEMSSYPQYAILLLYIGPTFVLALSLLICFPIIGPGEQLCLIYA